MSSTQATSGPVGPRDVLDVLVGVRSDMRAVEKRLEGMFQGALGCERTTTDELITETDLLVSDIVNELGNALHHAVRARIRAEYVVRALEIYRERDRARARNSKRDADGEHPGGAR